MLLTAKTSKLCWGHHTTEYIAFPAFVRTWLSWLNAVFFPICKHLCPSQPCWLSWSLTFLRSPCGDCVLAYWKGCVQVSLLSEEKSVVQRENAPLHYFNIIIIIILQRVWPQGLAGLQESAQHSRQHFQLFQQCLVCAWIHLHFCCCKGTHTLWKACSCNAVSPSGTMLYSGIW